MSFVLVTAAFAVAVDEERLKNPALEARAQAISESLRCLVCQNQSIAESDAPLAKDLRMLVRERVAAGDTDEEVREFIVRRYGEWVLLKPPFTAETLLLWLGPILLVCLGTIALLLIFRRPMPTGDLDPLTRAEKRRIAELMDEREQE